MVRNLDTAVLRTFLGVVDAASMTSAAAALNLTQAAVSQQIKRLEELFGAQLFERDRRGMKLTHAGEQLFGKARKLVALNDEIFAEMTAPTEEGEVRFGVPYDLVNTYLPPILKNFAKAFPRVKISLVSKPSVILRRLAEVRRGRHRAGRGSLPRRRLRGAGDRAAGVGRRQRRRGASEAAAARVVRQ